VSPPVLRPAAAADVEEAWLWYEAQREGLGDEFLQVVQDALESIAAFPESAPLVQRDIRRHLREALPVWALLQADPGPGGRRSLLPRQAQPASLAVSILNGFPGSQESGGGEDTGQEPLVVEWKDYKQRRSQEK
jgi:plasmid stabilization system protein ParE